MLRGKKRSYFLRRNAEIWEAKLDKYEPKTFQMLLKLERGMAEALKIQQKLKKENKGLECLGRWFDMGDG